LLRDISTIIANERVSIIGIESHTDTMKQTMAMSIKVEVTTSELLVRVVDKLCQLDDVIQVKRL
jgi:GTP pyrophosphokinase